MAWLTRVSLCIGLTVGLFAIQSARPMFGSIRLGRAN
jgi:hypothetical protein